MAKMAAHHLIALPHLKLMACAGLPTKWAQLINQQAGFAPLALQARYLALAHGSGHAWVQLVVLQRTASRSLCNMPLVALHMV